MEDERESPFRKVLSVFEQHTRGNEIALYTIAGAGLVFAIRRIRPFSKFSKARHIPEHFIEEKEILKGRITACEASTKFTRLMFDHRPLIKIPFWHSRKAPLTVEVWGVKPAGMNAVNWLQCIAVDQNATVLPLSRKDDVLVGQVRIHIPTANSIEVKKKKTPSVEVIDIGERLVELGLNVIADDVEIKPAKYNWWTPWIYDRNRSASLERAQHSAISRRMGHWQSIPRPMLQNIAAFFKARKIAAI